ncbi:MAG: CNNM domain-containing protein [Desulforegulaceae bacterium]|nr:CNNM domain-containing protein [Desulforegulaceae bacterium]
MKSIQDLFFLAIFLTPLSANASQPQLGSNYKADFIILIIYILLALIFSFLCSIAEAVLLSITPSYIEGKKQKNKKLFSILKQIKQDKIDSSLASILTLNTIAHTIGAIGAGAKATSVFGDAWFGVFSAAMTFMILFFSEIIPKTIGAVYWKSLVWPASIFIKSLIIILYPLVWISEKITKLISGGKKETIFNKEEFIAMAAAGEHSGELDKKESIIIKNLFCFHSLKAADIMTPRTVMLALKENIKISEAASKVSKQPFSRIPIFSSGVDDITGFVLKDDILIFAAEKKGEEKLSVLKRKIPAVPETVSLAVLFEDFLKNRHQIAVIVSEHGSTEGVVTLEDIIETLMGMEIVDETDNAVDMRVLARKQWIKRAQNMGIELDEREKAEK